MFLESLLGEVLHGLWSLLALALFGRGDTIWAVDLVFSVRFSFSFVHVD